MQNAEVWKPVLGYEGLYEVSSVGNVRSLHTYGKGKNGGLMRLTKQKGGHLLVGFKGGHSSHQLVHRVLLDAFYGKCKTPGIITRHLNGIPDDNRIENLARGSYAENANDAKLHGTFPIGEHNGKSKLTDKLVEYILTCSKTARQLQRELGFAYATINAVRLGVSWVHVRRDIPRPVVVRDKRGVKGADHYRAKVSERDVYEMRASALSSYKLAKIYRVSPATAYLIKSKKSWTHLP